MDLEDTISPMTTAARSTALTAATRYQLNAKTSLEVFGSKTGLRDCSSSKATISLHISAGADASGSCWARLTPSFISSCSLRHRLHASRCSRTRCDLSAASSPLQYADSCLMTCFVNIVIPLIRTRYADDPACEPTSCVPD